MKDGILGLIVCILLVVICYCLDRCSKVVITEAVTSSPVEEMYHKQLVTTLDSILDARFCPSCCKEYADTVNANTFHTRFNSILSPME